MNERKWKVVKRDGVWCALTPSGQVRLRFVNDWRRIVDFLMCFAKKANQ